LQQWTFILDIFYKAENDKLSVNKINLRLIDTMNIPKEKEKKARVHRASKYDKNFSTLCVLEI